VFHPKRPSNAEYRRIRVADAKFFSLNNDITSVAVLCLTLSHELLKLGSNRASCSGGLGFEPRHRDGQGFRIYCLLQQNVGVVTSYKAQKPAFSSFGFIIHIRCTIRFYVISLEINDVTLFN